MITSIKNFLQTKTILVVTSIALLSVLLIPNIALAQADPDPTVPSGAGPAVCEGIGGCKTPKGKKTVNDTIKLFLNLFSAIIGIISVIMIMIGGLKYITSAGDANSAKSARDTIIYAVVGLIVVAVAQIIVNFVIGSFG